MEVMVNGMQRLKIFVKQIVDRLRGRTSLETLVNRGLVLGTDVSIMPGCILDPAHCFLISIGDRVTLAPNVHVLAHDASTKRLMGYTKIGTVEIERDVFVGAGSIILPGVKIGEQTIIGAGSIVTKDIPPYSVAVGNPCKVMRTIEDK